MKHRTDRQERHSERLKIMEIGYWIGKFAGAMYWFSTSTRLSKSKLNFNGYEQKTLN